MTTPGQPSSPTEATGRPVASAAPVRSLRESKKERTRQALADAAMSLVLSEGYAGATIEAIAERAGVSVRTFHNYFPSKDAVFAHPFDQMCGSLNAHLQRQPEGIPLLDALIEAWMALFAEQQDQLVQVALVVSAVSEIQSIRDNVACTALASSAPLLTELARRDGNGPNSEMTAALALRIVIDATGLAFQAHPLNFYSATVDESVLRDSDDLLGDIRTALESLRRIASGAPSPIS